ncbi:PREDICTED: uncharacterized protein LOC109175478 [Ipomoea nil]|uniref:uncharacterized protein LOC109175478 n=1 Tax=Ipomoea nil TaxID=35883 RepID=UPI000900F67C|nr:PREDICTED: uncharacterized protein LOC109175478 [Ipomoea nil]
MAQDRTTQQVLLRGPSQGGVYSLTASSKVAFLSVRASPKVWHNRLGTRTFESCVRYLDRDTGRIYLARHVRFNEETFPFQGMRHTIATFASGEASSSPWACAPVQQPTPPSQSVPAPPTLPPLPPAPQLAILTSSSSTTGATSSSFQPTTSSTTTTRRRRVRSNVRTHVMQLWTTTNARRRNPVPQPTALVVSVDDDEPTYHTQAIKFPHWRAAMDTEFNALLQNLTWLLVLARHDMNVIGCKWVFRVKGKSDGTIDHYKARLVAKGFNQIPGKDYSENTVRAYILVYVDDILLLGNDYDMLSGIEASYDKDALMLTQQRYMNELLRRAGMESYKQLSTPMSLATSDAVTESLPLDDPMPYRHLVGSLMYLLITRPDLSFAVNHLCQFMHTPTQDHWVALKRVLRYVQGTRRLGLRLTLASSPVVHAFSDSDWAGCSLDRKFTAGYTVFLGPNLVS